MNAPYTSSELLFDREENRRLAEIFSDCFALILQLRATDDMGEPDMLRQRLKELLRRAERQASQVGVPYDQVRSANFALVAFIDETILSSNWRHKEAWLTQPLQKDLFDRTDAGEEFFSRVEELLQDPLRHAEVLEVYYLCMTLGFKGKYQLHSQEQLRMLIEDLREQLKRAPGLKATRLAPHGKPRDQVVAEFKSKVPMWVVAAVVGAIAFLAYVGMSFYVSGAAEETARAIEAVIQATGG